MLKSLMRLIKASATECPSLQVAVNVPMIVILPQVTCVLIVAAWAKLTANVRGRTCLNIGFLMGVPSKVSSVEASHWKYRHCHEKQQSDTQQGPRGRFRQIHADECVRGIRK